jgi:N utilization substance protein B
MLNRRLLRIKIYQGLYAMHNLQLRTIEQGKALIANQFFVPFEERTEEYDADIDTARTVLATSIFEEYLGKLQLPHEVSTDLEPAVFSVIVKALRFYREELNEVHHTQFRSIVSETKNLSLEYARLLWFLRELVNQQREDETRKGARFIDNEPSKAHLLKFANNPIVSALESFPQLEVAAARNNLGYEPTEGFFRQLFKEHIKADVKYLAYIALEEATLEDHLNFFKHLVKQLLFTYVPSVSFFQANSITWEEDADVIKNLSIKTLKVIAASPAEMPTLMALATDWEDDQVFMDTLYFKTWEERATLDANLAAVSKNWDPSRLALSDELLLKMAITEFKHCNSIPLKVTINEYVDIAKGYSTPNSGTFINGMLDSLANKLKEAGEIKKSGKGML